MDHESWLIVVKSKHFVYRVEAERPWTPEKILELLEGCYQEYYEMMGTGLKTFIEVEDRLCPSEKLSAILSGGKVICEFPKEFGKIQNAWELAYHFFAHEVFHLWVGGYTISHGEVIEALTQYMADRTLAKLGWIDNNRLTDSLKKRRISNTSIDRYYIRFYDLEAEKGEAILYKLCRELAECYRAIFPTDESADVTPILNRYLGDI